LPPCQVNWTWLAEKRSRNRRWRMRGWLSSPKAGGSEAAVGAEDPEGTPRSFEPRPDLEALASEQEVEPAEDFAVLLGDFWLDSEDANEFVTALRTWRRDDGAKT
jgi:hypothetical protein